MTNNIQLTFSTWHINRTLHKAATAHNVVFVNVMPEPNGSTQLTVTGHMADVYNFVTELNLSFALIVNANR